MLMDRALLRKATLLLEKHSMAPMEAVAPPPAPPPVAAPAPPGAPMAAAGAAPPPGAPPMDPAMAGGAPPMDPAMAGEDPLVKLLQDIEEIKTMVKQTRELISGIGESITQLPLQSLLQASDPAKAESTPKESFELPHGFVFSEQDGDASTPPPDVEDVTARPANDRFSAAAKVAALAFQRRQ